MQPQTRYLKVVKHQHLPQQLSQRMTICGTWGHTLWFASTFTNDMCPPWAKHQGSKKLANIPLMCLMSTQHTPCSSTCHAKQWTNVNTSRSLPFSPSIQAIRVCERLCHCHSINVNCRRNLRSGTKIQHSFHEARTRHLADCKKWTGSNWEEVALLEFCTDEQVMRNIEENQAEQAVFIQTWQIPATETISARRQLYWGHPDNLNRFEYFNLLQNRLYTAQSNC